MTYHSTLTDVSSEQFVDAMSRFPSGVTVTVTRGQRGELAGFTASAFCSLSSDPPLIAVCLATNANCYHDFRTAERFAVHVIGLEHKQIALRFATKGADKFAGEDFTEHADGLPALSGAIVRLSCSVEAIHPGGDHSILIGRVRGIDAKDGNPAVYVERAFHSL